MIQDFRFAGRQLFKAPTFTVAAAIVLAFGIGANTAVFSLVNTLFFAPPAYAKPYELAQLFSQDKKDPKKFRDPIAFTAAPLPLAIAALVATWLPARRAAALNPVEALRYE
jgi:ABC-type antimicrobial peptide transport system permease subunit